MESSFGGYHQSYSIEASAILDVVCICIITESIFFIFLNDGDVAPQNRCTNYK
jgi:hypothetical protein